MNSRITLCFIFAINLTISVFGQVNAEIGDKSEESTSLSLQLSHRFQKYKSSGLHKNDHYDRSINSPKSVKIIDAKKKFYIHSLEGYTTSVYSFENFKLLKTIEHKFNETNKALFQDTFYFNQKFRTKSSDWNTFKGKPVESCLSHNGKYLWVTYYRRSYDANAIDPSAVCIIDTDNDSIVRVIPTGPLPKMITCSPDNKHIAISHWGNNTVALIDIQGNNPKEFHYVTELLVDKKMSLDYGQDEKIDRDQGCGACLRGTIFTPDSKYLLIGKMGGASIAIIDIEKKKHLGDIKGMRGNLRHLIINNGWLYLSINKYGYIQRTPVMKFIAHLEKMDEPYKNWDEVYVGTGARTIEATSDGKFIFACINNESKLVVVNTETFEVETKIQVDSYPVGLAISKDNQWAITTSQGKSSKGGNSVCVFKLNFY
jgi:DNA-binding beta-propeller fold protein YncE